MSFLKLRKEMELWPAIWNRDFGFAPIGVHKVVSNMLWWFDNKCLEDDLYGWSQADLYQLCEAQIAAAFSRVIRLDFTLQFRGKDVWLHRPLVGDSAECYSKLFDTEELLIRNLARMSEWLLDSDFVHPRIVATDGQTNLHMLLGKFDFA